MAHPNLRAQRSSSGLAHSILCPTSKQVKLMITRRFPWSINIESMICAAFTGEAETMREMDELECSRRVSAPITTEFDHHLIFHVPSQLFSRPSKTSEKKQSLTTSNLKLCYVSSCRPPLKPAKQILGAPLGATKVCSHISRSNGANGGG